MFQRSQPMMDEGGLTVASIAKAEIVAAVTMSPQSFKDLYLLMQGQVETFEKDFGEIVTRFARSRKK